MELSLEDWRVKNFMMAVVFVIAYNAIANLYIGQAELPFWEQFLILTLAPAIVFAMYFGRIAFDDEWKKIVGIIIGYLSWDILSVGQFINTDGVTLTGAKFYEGTTDVLVASLFQALGISGVMLWVCVYILSPIIGILIAVNLLSKREFTNGF